MRFNQNWSEPFIFQPGHDSPEVIKYWGCDGKNGIYVIRDASDNVTLYVGSAGQKDYVQGDRNIAVRLNEHLTGKSHRIEINDLVNRGETFTVRWVESQNPKVAEEIAIIQLQPKFNGRNEWKEFDRFDDREFAVEAIRLGMIDRDPYMAIAKYVVEMQERDVRLTEGIKEIAKPEINNMSDIFQKSEESKVFLRQAEASDRPAKSALTNMQAATNPIDRDKFKAEAAGHQQESARLRSESTKRREQLKALKPHQANKEKEKAPLKGLPDREYGYKKDGRGTYSDNGTHSVRHSVDQLKDGRIQEHVVTTDKKTGEKEIKSQTYDLKNLEKEGRDR